MWAICHIYIYFSIWISLLIWRVGSLLSTIIILNYLLFSFFSKTENYSSFYVNGLQVYQCWNQLIDFVIVCDIYFFFYFLFFFIFSFFLSKNKLEMIQIMYFNYVSIELLLQTIVLRVHIHQLIDVTSLTVIIIKDCNIIFGKGNFN